MSVLAGIEQELQKLPEELRDSGLAAIARAMAERIDSGRGSPSECGKVAIDALTRLRELAPEEVKADGIDDLAKQRVKRRGGAAA